MNSRDSEGRSRIQKQNQERGIFTTKSLLSETSRSEVPTCHTRLSMRADSQVNCWIIAQETRPKSAIPTGYVHVQPAERAEWPPFWYKSLYVPFILFAFMNACGMPWRGCPGQKLKSTPVSPGQHVRLRLICQGKRSREILFTSAKAKSTPV